MTFDEWLVLEHGCNHGWTFFEVDAAREAWEASAKIEREECAKIVDVADGTQAWEIRGGEEGIELLRDMAAAIRAR
jgi:hypothetical protein